MIGIAVYGDGWPVAFVSESDLDFLSALNAAAAVTTVIAAVLVASNLSPKTMVLGFSVFVIASLLWMASGYVDEKPSLIIQNIILLIVNLAGIWRWAPKT